MKPLICTGLICLLAQPLAAQQAGPAPEQDGASLMQEGAKLLFRGLMSGMQPTIKDMGRALTEMEPALRGLMAMMGDISKYHAPEMLDNGDIIIRRKRASDLPPTGAEIDL